MEFIMLIQDTGLQEWSDSLRNRRVIDQFAEANDMVPRKHGLSHELLKYIAIRKDIEYLEQQPGSVLRDSLVDALKNDLDQPIMSSDTQMMQEVIAKNKALELQVFKLKVELDIAEEKFHTYNGERENQTLTQALYDESIEIWVSRSRWRRFLYPLK
jgi:hypothetical protein